MSVIAEAAVETNGKGFLVYAENYPGAYSRGCTEAEALAKLPADINAYSLWVYGATLDGVEVLVRQRHVTTLSVEDADSELLLDGEREPLTQAEYEALKMLAIQSACDFQALYDSIPDKTRPLCPPRQTFYGDLPATAELMYRHVNDVAAYYTGEVGAQHENVPDIAENRMQALKLVEALPNHLTAGVFTGSYDELWSLRKVLRRFIWHDRIHARAMQRHAAAIWGADAVADPYCFHQGGLI